MEVGGAAAEVRGEAEDVGLGAVGGPGFAVQADFDLVGFLVVLVGPHVVGEGAGERVEGDLFEAVAEGRVAEDGEGLLEREHGLDDGAELGALRGAAAGEVLVAGEHAVGLAVVAIELPELMEDGAAIGLGAGDERPDGGGFDGLAVVDAVGGEGEVVHAAVLIELDELAGDGDFVLEVGEVGLPVEALGVEQAGEVEELWVAGAVVEPEDYQGVVLPAELAPVAEGAGGKSGELIGEVAGEERDDAGVVGGFLVLREDFEHDHAGPPIVVALGSGDGAEHAVGGLRAEGPLDPGLGFLLEARVVELHMRGG